MARLEELEEVSAGAIAAAEADAKRAQEEAAVKVEKNNERANEVRLGLQRMALWPCAVSCTVKDPANMKLD